MDELHLAAAGIAVTVDLRVGHIADLVIDHTGKRLRPLHRAPWADEAGAELESLGGGLRYLSGDFLCAPFSASDVEPAPPHGWTASSRWTVETTEKLPDGMRARLKLARRIMGATVEKILTLRDGHPFLYQEHVFHGGEGAIPVAHHAMTVMRDGGRLSFSPKRLALTPDVPLEPDPARGRYRLVYPARSDDLHAFPSLSGPTDLADYRTGRRTEDFVMLVEAGHAGPGWTAVARRAERDLVLVLKNPADLPVTMLWLSDGGRDYAPWNGRHLGVLGIEDGRTAVGHAASLGDNPLPREGVATSFALAPEGRVAFRHPIGGIWLDNGAAAPSHLSVAGETLTAGFADGKTLASPFDGAFLASPPAV